MAFNPKVDEYISKAQPFAQPILEHLRQLVHQTCPDVNETIKWGFPHFEYRNEMMCSMASFKQHAVFGFWKAAIMNVPQLMENAQSEISMGHLGKICSVKDLPSDKQLAAWIKKAMQLNEEGIKLPAKKKAPAKAIAIPADFKKLLSAHPKAQKTFAAFSPSHRKEYLEWITEAKTATTRNKRMATTIEWLEEGKSRNWKYK